MSNTRPASASEAADSQELGSAWVDAVVVVPASRHIALVRGAVTGVGAQLALEAVEDEQDAVLPERTDHDVELFAVGKAGGRVIGSPRRIVRPGRGRRAKWESCS